MAFAKDNKGLLPIRSLYNNTTCSEPVPASTNSIDLTIKVSGWKATLEILKVNPPTAVPDP